MKKKVDSIIERIIVVLVCFSLLCGNLEVVKAVTETTYLYMLPKNLSSSGSSVETTWGHTKFSTVPSYETVVAPFSESTMPVALKSGYHWGWEVGYKNWPSKAYTTKTFFVGIGESMASVNSRLDALGQTDEWLVFTYAQIPNTYTVSYKANGGSGTMANSTATFHANFKTSKNTFTRTGYTFNGWNEKADGSGTAWNLNSAGVYESGTAWKWTYTTNITLYAQWKPNIYTITLDHQNADVSGTTAYYEKYNTGNYTTSGCSTTISTITKPERKGYTFGGYYTQKNGGGTCYINAAGLITSNKTSFTGNITLYAKWILNEYKISYDANGGTGSMENSVIPELGGTLSKNLFTREGYTFQGWATSTSGETVYGEKDLIYPSKDTTLYAVWKINSHKVNYDANGGKSDTTYIMHNYGANIDLSPIATKEGYTFVGWGTDASAKLPLTTLVMGDSEINLYAIYSIAVSDIAKNEVYLLIQLKEDSAREKIYPLTYQFDVSRMVYRYKLDSTDVSSFVQNEDYFYYVIAKDNAGNISVLHSGSVKAGGILEENPNPPIPNLPKEYNQTVKHYKYNPRTESEEKWDWFDTVTERVKENMLFEPSYIKAPIGYEENHIDMGEIVSGDNVYHAYYMPKEYTLYFEAQGGISDVEFKRVMYDNYYGELPIAVRDGYTFEGWNTKIDGSGITIKRSDVYSIAEDVTIYAQWTPNIYRITLDNQGSDIPGTIAYYEKYDSGNYTSEECSNEISIIKIPEKMGYRFNGYYTEKGGNGKCYVDQSGRITSSKTTFIEDIILYADWEVNTYTIQYHPNTGNGTMDRTTATYDKSVGLSANAFSKTGYTFAGWSIRADGEVEYKDKEYVRNLSPEHGANVTLYAVWKINSYHVKYDYITNGGDSASADEIAFDYGTEIDLTPTAIKENYTFVGWNTDSTATTGLPSLSVGTESITLYAIFKKDIEISFKELSNSGTVTTTKTKTVYNNTTHADFLVEETVSRNSWENIGWTTETSAMADAELSSGANYTTDRSGTVYAKYHSVVELSYDTNGAAITIDDVEKDCYANASGDYVYPQYVVANAPFLDGYSFVKWEVKNGHILDENSISQTTILPKENITVLENTTLNAVWDKHPVVEAYHRYFTLEQARNGEITEAELLKKVRAVDEEAKSSMNPEGILENGIEVIVKNYNDFNFTDMTGNNEIYVTYQATDSFGNIATKTVVVSITDTTAQKSRKKKYVRFISRDFFMDEAGNLRSSKQGGLEETSIWRTNIYYQELLRETILNENINRMEKESWLFCPKDRKEVKAYTQIYGHVQNALEEFFKMFAKCNLR